MRAGCVVVMSLLVAAAMVSATSEAENVMVAKSFAGFMQQYKRNYGTLEETFARMEIFRRNLQKIEAHNADPSNTWTMGVNQFADLTAEEFATRLTHPAASASPALTTAPVTADPPESFDWREHQPSVVSPVHDEGQCGSTWAWAPVECMETANALKTGALVELSTQELVDCDTAESQGCNGGYPSGAYQWAITNGLCSAKDYPYTATGPNDCQKDKCTAVATFSSFVELALNETGLVDAVLINPINIQLDATRFQFYTGGVLDDPKCFGGYVNHCVTLLGYGTDNGVQYWQMRNQWGTAWGEQGYIRLARGKNMCGMVSSADFPPAYPIV